MSTSEVEQLRDRVEELQSLLGMRTLLPKPWGLDRREAEIFGILLRRPIISREQLLQAIWGGLDREIIVVNVTLHKMRRKLKPLGIQIKNDRGVGYYLPPEGKRIARSLIEAYERECA